MNVLDVVYGLAILFAVLFVGSFIQGLTGFGAGIIAMGFISLVVPLKTGTLLVLAVTVVMCLGILARNREHIKIGEIKLLLASALVSRAAAFFVMDAFGGEEAMKRVLGATLILMVALLWRGRVAGAGHGAATVSVGFFGGFIGGLFAVGGPIYALYFLHRYKDKREYMANLQLTFLLANLLTLGAHGFNGDIGFDFVPAFLIGAAASWLGVRSGMLFFGKAPDGFIRKAAFLIVLFGGLHLMVFP
ncbi:sulfite exporter TauE/SafE family protein [Cohnella hongkongensis]|uniref:Probable membrane transporter protein n=1 Tax=Cohnella hongkongensis TaxID=178337 RepID=A0ABV9F9T7_9BACL